MWGSLLDGSRRFFSSSNTVVGDSGPPLFPKPKSNTGGRGEAHPIRYKRGDVTYRRLVLRGVLLIRRL